VASGDGFLGRPALRDRPRHPGCRDVCRYEFSLFVGASEGEPGTFAQRLHASLIAPSRSVLILVDPAARVLEIVTGSVVRRDLPDDAVRLAAVAMESAFSEGDLVGGIKRGVNQLAEAARKPAPLHASN